MGLARARERPSEQALRTDQDHALAYDADGGAIEAVDPYFSSEWRRP
ncbi:MAG: hypothetical protein U0V56_12520 [Actinomycetota bacterium]